MPDIASLPQTQSIEIPSLPHMSPPQIAYLRDRLTKSQCFLEFGAGGSSMLASELNVPKIFSVESDKAFAGAVEFAVRASTTKSAYSMSVVDIGKTGQWGTPVNTDRMRHWPKYSLQIWDTLKASGDTPDLVLIDGRFRVACALASLIFCRDHTTIMIDDYSKRVKRYGIVANFTKNMVMIDRMAVFEADPGRDKLQIAIELARFVNDER